MEQLDLNFIRSHFPAFSEEKLKDKAFFENAGGSYMCKQVIERFDRYFKQRKVQPYGFYEASALAGEEMDSARARMAEYLNVNTDEVLFGPSTSQNTYVLAQSFLENMNESDEIILLKSVVTGAATGTTVGASGSFTQNSFYFTATQLQRYDASGVLSTVNDINTRQYWLCIRNTSTGPSNSNTAFRKIRVYQTFSSTGTYYGYTDKGFNDIVLQNGAFWRVQRTTVTGYGGGQTSGNISENDFWTKADRCGKQITSCKLRFQAKLHPSISGAFHALHDNTKALPFGGYPGVVQRRR